MKPIIAKVNLTELPNKMQQRICPCKVKCTEGLTFTFHNDGNIICLGDSRKMMHELIRELGAEGYTTWTQSEEDFILEHYEQNGMYRGFNTYIANALGKPYGSVKSKTRRMKEAGKFGKKVRYIAKSEVIGDQP